MQVKANLRIGICQMMVVDDKESNLRKAQEMIRKASRQGCNLVVLPEMFNCPYESMAFPSYAEPIPNGETSLLLSRTAREEHIYLVGGSIPEIDSGGRIFNSCPVFGPNGQFLGCHRKVHLFDVDLESGLSFRESDTLKAGDSLTIIPIPAATLGILICYDIRFPELSRLLSLSGVQVLVVPAAFNTTTGPAHWEILLRTRAIDNQVFVVGAAPATNPVASYHAWGHSMVVDPWGSVLASTGSTETVLWADLDLSRIEQVRKALPLLRHRRTDLYTLKRR